MRTSSIRHAILTGLISVSLALPALAQQEITTDVGTLDRASAERASQKPPYSPYAGRNFPTRPFFGDTHLHTSFSMDAGAFGQLVKLSRPLDFLVVADHSDNMGFFPDLFAGDPKVLADPTGRRWYDMVQSGKGAEAAIEIIVAFSQGTFPKTLMCAPGTPPYRLDQHHRHPRAHHGVEGPGLRPGAARLLLRPCYRDPDAALDRV
jgi:hypothetical protein